MGSDYRNYSITYNLRGDYRRFNTSARSIEEAFSNLEESSPHLVFFPGNYDGCKEPILKIKVMITPLREETKRNIRKRILPS